MLADDLRHVQTLGLYVDFALHPGRPEHDEHRPQDRSRLHRVRIRDRDRGASARVTETNTPS
jgi:hypothetical protein